jgi:hypothetical protein
MNTLRNSSKLMMSLMIIMLMTLGTGCKSKKKAMEAQAAADKAKMEQEAALQRERDAELKRQQEAEEAAKRNAQATTEAPAQKLDLFFSAIANSNNVNAANSSMNEALSLFASPDAPVLIVISEEAGQKDYDRPTTIAQYLNYLKDTKKNMNKIGNLQFDASGKITEVELIKQK